MRHTGARGLRTNCALRIRSQRLWGRPTAGAKAASCPSAVEPQALGAASFTSVMARLAHIRKLAAHADAGVQIRWGVGRRQTVSLKAAGCTLSVCADDFRIEREYRLRTAAIFGNL